MIDPHMAASVRITVKDGLNVSAVSVLSTLNELLCDGQFSDKDRAFIARMLAEGEGWEPEPTMLRSEVVLRLMHDGPFNIKLNMYVLQSSAGTADEIDVEKHDDLYDIESVRITMKDGAGYDAVELTKLLQKLIVPGEFTSRELLYIARCLMNGEGWEPSLMSLCFNELSHQRRNGPLNFKFTKREDPAAEQKQRWLETHELLERACAGDAEAAIEYCRRVKDGRISFEPSAGSAY
jgi:hypothetical protein